MSCQTISIVLPPMLKLPSTKLSPRTGNSAGIPHHESLGPWTDEELGTFVETQGEIPHSALRRFVSIPSTCRLACSLTTFIVCVVCPRRLMGRAGHAAIHSLS
jgi:hypothetical protein